MKRNRNLPLVGPLLFLAACGELPSEGVESTRSPITGGSLVPPGSHAAPDTSTVKLGLPFGQECTAFKVIRQPFSQTVFWTAGHCLDSVQVGSPIRITNNLDGNFDGPNSYTTTVTWFQRHPSRQNWINAIDQSSRDGRRFHYDVAQFTVAGSTSNIPGYNTSNMDFRGPGEQVTYTGYGCDSINPANDGKKQYAYFNLSPAGDVFPFFFEKTPFYVSHNMTAVGDSPQACPGDSGSAVWKWFGSDWRTVGIVVHGGAGYTGMARFSNTGSWLKAPAVNNIAHNSAGTLMNELSGLCLAVNGSTVSEGICDTSAQSASPAYWRLKAANALSGSPYQIVNGQNGQCLDVATAAEGSALVTRPCAGSVALPFSTQRWQFSATNHADYRRLVNTSTGFCTRPTDPNTDFGSVGSYTCDTLSTWRQQAYMFYN